MANLQGTCGARTTAWWRVWPIALLLGLSACSWFDEETPETQRIAAEGVDENAPYPSLSSVPDSPPRPSPDEQRDSLSEGLTADHDNARYSGETLTVASVAVPEAGPPVPASGGGQSRSQAAPEPPPAEPAAPLAAPAGAVAASELGSTPGAAQSAALSDSAAGLSSGELVAVIYFPDGGDQVSAADRALLRDIVALQGQRGGDLRVVGHESAGGAGDGVEAEVSSFEVSLRRANAVAEAMIGLGAPAGQLRVVAAADNQPVYEESQATGAAGNRRVEIFLQ